MSELRECPFCGATPDINSPHTFRCDQGDKWGFVECCCRGPEVRTDYMPLESWRDDAISAWNTRPADAVREAARALLEADEALWGYAASHTDMTGAGWQSLREQFDARLADLRAALAQDGRG